MHIQEVFDLVKDDLKQMEDSFKQNISSSVYLVSKVSEYILNSGGKRFRPLVLLLAARLCEYKGDRHIPMASVMEFIHTATLLHDDVVDNARLRRGSASANEVWGQGPSILVGDYLLSRAFALTVANGDMRALNALSRTTTRMAEGEVLQLVKHGDPNTTEKEYLDVITYKTAVLISLSAQMPAILSNVDPKKEEALIDYGLGLGIAYQLMDDCLDYISTDEDLGKSIGNDLREGKLTMPLIHAISKATDSERALLVCAVETDNFSESTLREVISIINKYKGIEHTIDRAHAYIANAKKALDIFQPNTEHAALLAVADYVIERKH